MVSDDQLALEQMRLDADVKKAEARWGFWKVVVGTGLVGIAAAFFPFAQQLATLHFEAQIETAKAEAQLEVQRNNLEFETKQHDRAALNEAKKFLQDVSREERAKTLDERIVLAEYFVYLSESDAERKKWEHFLEFLNRKRAVIVQAEIEAVKVAGSGAKPAVIAEAEQKAKGLRESAGIDITQAPPETGSTSVATEGLPLDDAAFNRELAKLLAPDSATRRTARSRLANMGLALIEPAMGELANEKIAYRLRLGLVVALTEMMRENKDQRQQILGLLSAGDIDVLLAAAVDDDRTIRIYAGEFLFDLGDPRAFHKALEKWKGEVSDNGRFNLVLVMKGAVLNLRAADAESARTALESLKGDVGPKTDQLIDEAITLLPN